MNRSILLPCPTHYPFNYRLKPRLNPFSIKYDPAGSSTYIILSKHIDGAPNPRKNVWFCRAIQS
jgi:hypothetical protein